MMRTAPRRDRRRARPQLEGLEDRKLLYATLGGTWAFNERVTYSFAPDGTDVGGTPSDLHDALSDLGISETSWKDQVRRAASVWQAVADINLAEVSDDGSDLGESGYNQQNDSHFGDIRIAGVTLAAGVLGQAYYPPPFNGGALAGDIILNSNAAWKINGTTYDLQTVAIHEFGHALGMGHSAISTAVMYAYYGGSRQSLTTDDTNGIQSIFGQRTQDFLDTNGTNNTLATADSITSYLSSGRLAISGLDLTTASDHDFYLVKVPAGHNGTMTVRVQSDGISSLSPRVMVYTESGRFLDSTTAPNSYGETVSVSIGSITQGETYAIRVLAANTGSSAVGGYGLLVNFVGGTQAPISPPNTTVHEQADQGGGGGSLESLNALLNLHDEEGAHDLSFGSLSGVGHELTIGGWGGGDHHHDGEDWTFRPTAFTIIAPPPADESLTPPATTRTRSRGRTFDGRALASWASQSGRGLLRP